MFQYFVLFLRMIIQNFIYFVPKNATKDLKDCMILFIFFLYSTSALKFTFKSMDYFMLRCLRIFVILVKIISITEILTFLWTRVIHGRTCIINLLIEFNSQWKILMEENYLLINLFDFNFENLFEKIDMIWYKSALNKLFCTTKYIRTLD